MPAHKPVLLTILDGWGQRGEREYNAIATANTPVWDDLLAHYPHGVINASEEYVGLPSGQMGNSEVGHMNIGSGRVVMQDLPRIDAAIADDSLAENPELTNFINKLKSGGGACHMLGLLSPGGVHSHQRHMAYLAKTIAASGLKVWVHIFLDGRDTPPQSAMNYLQQFERDISDVDGIACATVCGRYFAMDRDKRWDRIEQAYNVIVDADGEVAESAEAAIAAAYERDISDEFVPPIALTGYTGMRDGDGLLMTNFRADRARQIVTALLDPEFSGFPRKRRVSFAAALGMVEYSTELARLLPALFPPESLTNTLGEVMANAGKTQLRIAETEKYAHVTFFFNGGREQPFSGEDRILVPSPQVATYDLQPEMSAPQLTDKLAEAIISGKYDLIIANFANTDMVGHSGDFSAAVKAVEAVDACLGKLKRAVDAVGSNWIITADHGNAELMVDTSGNKQPHTAHTMNLVPFVVVGSYWKDSNISIREGRLADIAPTILRLLDMPKPDEMTGSSLI